MTDQSITNVREFVDSFAAEIGVQPGDICIKYSPCLDDDGDDMSWSVSVTIMHKGPHERKARPHTYDDWGQSITDAAEKLRHTLSVFKAWEPKLPFTVKPAVITPSDI